MKIQDVTGSNSSFVNFVVAVAVVVIFGITALQVADFVEIDLYGELIETVNPTKNEGK